jgi:hypothetical protein
MLSGALSVCPGPAARSAACAAVLRLEAGPPPVGLPAAPLTARSHLCGTDRAASSAITRGVQQQHLGRQRRQQLSIPYEKGAGLLVRRLSHVLIRIWPTDRNSSVRLR